MQLTAARTQRQLALAIAHGTTQQPQADGDRLHSSTPNCSPMLIQAVMESFMDGVLILTAQGELIRANTLAQKICARLGSPIAQTVPAEIWQICQAFLDVYPNYLRAEAELDLPAAAPLRVRVRSLPQSSTSHPYLLVILEDPAQPACKLALHEVDRYGLTPREAEVWLRRRANYSYKRIAQELYITVNTVKKHLKNIYAKRLSLDLDEPALDGL